MQEFLEFLKGFNFQTIISMAVIVWYFSRHIEAKIDAQSVRTDRLYEMYLEQNRDFHKEIIDLRKDFYNDMKEAAKKS